MAMFQNVKYEYVFNDDRQLELVVDDILSNSTESLTSSGNSYQHLIYYIYRGRQYAVTVQNKRNLVFINLSKKEAKVVPLPYDSDILNIQRYSGFILVQYSTFVEFVTLENKELVEPIHKISQTEVLEHVQHDIDNPKNLFVQTASNIYYYSCDGLMQMQYNQLNLLNNANLGCSFVRKIITDEQRRPDDKIINFQSLCNTILVHYASGLTDIFYSKDMLQANLYGDMKVLQAPLRLMQTFSSPVGAADFTKVAQARTNLNSLYMSKTKRVVNEDEGAFKGDVLVLNQYIPLPAYRSNVNRNLDAISDFLGEFKTQIVFIMFIVVLALQIYWKKTKAD